MSLNRWERISAQYFETDADRPVGERLCDLACMGLHTQRASVGLLSGNHLIPVAATDDIAQVLSDQQFTLGDGPVFEAARTDAPIVVADLSSAEAGSRWPAFVPVATELGVRAAFAFPLRVGAAHLGVMAAYHHSPLIPTPDAVADAMVLATFAADVMIAIQAGDGHLSEVLASNFSTGSEVHQAAGMVSEQLGISIVEALVRLRSYSYVSGRPLSAVARSVAQGHLFLDP